MHEDLIGYKFTDEFGHTLEVTKAVEWGEQYVQCETEERDYRTVRNASALRQHRSLNESQETQATVEEDAEEPGESSS